MANLLRFTLAAAAVVVALACLATAVTAEEQHCSAPDQCGAAAPCKEASPPTRALATEAKADAAEFEVFVSMSPNVHSDNTARLQRSLAVQQIKFTALPSGSALNSKATKELLAARTPATVVMFLNGNDFIFAAEKQEILTKFADAKSKILFSAQRNCDILCDKAWPTVAEEPLAPLYLDSTAVIGTAGDLTALLEKFGPGDARQNLSKLYLEDANSGIKLDTGCAIFQNLKYMGDDVDDGYISIEMVKVGNNKTDPRVFNEVSRTHPAVVRGAGNVKLLDQIGNYVPLAWNIESGCIECKEHNACINVTAPGADVPHIFVDFAVESLSPFLDAVLQNFAKQSYPKKKMTVRFSIEHGSFAVKYKEHIANWTTAHKSDYADVTVHVEDGLSALNARLSAFTAFEATAATHILRFSSLSFLTEPTTIARLVNMKRHVAGVVITRIGKLFSNVWGSILGDFASQCRDESESCSLWKEQGECENNGKFMAASCPLSCGLCQEPGAAADVNYKRSFDYGDIISQEKLGIWNVPFAYSLLLIDRFAAAHLVAVMKSTASSSSAADKALAAERNPFVIDVQVCFWLHQGEFGVFVSNELQFGDLIDATGFDSTKLHPDIFLLENNWRPWSDQYIHANYSADYNLSFVKDSFDGSKMCWDIYNFPLVNDRFCDELVALSEQYGKWSGADKYGGLPNEDERLSGGYEPVPTQDIHFRQKGMDFAQTWYYILKFFINPVVEQAYPGYSIDGRQTLDFIVKYRPDGQPFLRPHHDASTISVNVALNHIGLDFEGGGTRFLRQNCTILTNKKGYALFHPGRLTHQHEGLYVTKGTRYILVSFVDQ
eukprot:m.123810 g.123810  ORF g.123810 m.123810 type:complete len:834 (+) comp16265_c1_seq1:67-2568(+)